MLTDSTLQRAFRLIYGLHPKRTVAICILLDACEWISSLRNLQRRRHGYKLQTPEAGLIQFSVYSISERWEKDQESECPTEEPIYKPTLNDRLVRYVKALVLKSMDWASPTYAAVGLGCLLYRYDSHEVTFLAEEVFKSENIRRVKSKMIELLKKRFTGKNELSNGNGELQFEVPSDGQRKLIKTSLSRFAPWNRCSSTHSDSLLETYFHEPSDKTEWERLHVLFDCACGGFPRLVNEYNSNFSKGNKMLLDDPEHKLGSPRFDDDSDGPTGSGGGEPPEPPDRFNPSPLTDDELAIIRHILEKNERRRNKFRASKLRVVVDGEEIAAINPSTHEPFAIPATASCIEIFGEDEDGELLLAVLPLNYGGGAADSFKQQISVIGNQRIDVSIVHWNVQHEQCSDQNKNFVLLNYSERFNPQATNTVVGVSLREEFSEIGMELERVAELGRKIGETISAAHAAGVFHCNLKPANILLSNTDDKEHVTIIDFGLTKPLFDQTADDAGAAYMAPEQFYSNECSVQSDVYAMGAILYEMVTGQSPFPADLPYQLVISKREEIKANLCELRPGLPQSAQRVILKALAFEPEHRYGSAQELGDALAEALTANRKAKSIRPLVARSEAQQIAFALWMEGHSLRGIAQRLSAEGMRCSHTTVHSWIKKVTTNFSRHDRVEVAAPLKRIRKSS
jgi:protein kinase-like protein